MNTVAQLQPQHPDAQSPGIMLLKSGTYFDLCNPTLDDIHFEDIAWSLSRQIRYNGHIPYAYTVARHSILMSYVVEPENAVEALLHDAGEAYVSDVVQPLKKLFPGIEELEDRITALIMTKFNPNWTKKQGHLIYKKSPDVHHWDTEIYYHECWLFDRHRDAKYSEELTTAGLRANQEVGLDFLRSTSNENDHRAFFSRYNQLVPESMQQ